MAHGHGETTAQHAAHPTPKFFWKVALWLTVITALEVWAVYIDAIRGVLAPILIILSVLKFVLVVGYFMHLKWDARAYTGFFTFGMLVALIVYFFVIVMSN